LQPASEDPQILPRQVDASVHTVEEMELSTIFLQRTAKRLKEIHIAENGLGPKSAKDPPAVFR
jgi:hypothetical protein